MSDIYKPPSADMSYSAPASTPSLSGFGSVDAGIAGQYDFSISEVISEAWKKTNGTKGTLWLALLFFVIVAIPASMLVDFILRIADISYVPGDPTSRLISAKGLSHLINLVITVPLGTGLAMIGIKFAAGAPAEASDIFQYFRKLVPLLTATLIMYALIIGGFFLLIVPAIYLGLAYSLSLQLIADKGMSPWEALETSRKAITHHWWKLFGLYFVVGLIMFASMIPLGIGLIWTYPMGTLVKGIVYRIIFGYNGEVMTPPNVALDG